MIHSACGSASGTDQLVKRHPSPTLAVHLQDVGVSRERGAARTASADWHRLASHQVATVSSLVKVLPLYTPVDRIGEECGRFVRRHSAKTDSSYSVGLVSLISSG